MSCGPRRRYWVYTTTGNLLAATDTPASLDLTAVRMRHREVLWWRIVALMCSRAPTTALGVLRVNAFVADGVDLGADIVLGAGQTASDIDLLLPDAWSGQLAYNLNNRTGSTTSFDLSFGIEPLFDGTEALW